MCSITLLQIWQTVINHATTQKTVYTLTSLEYGGRDGLKAQKAVSPGQTPWVSVWQGMRPAGAKASATQWKSNAFVLTGRWKLYEYTPGLTAFGLSARVDTTLSDQKKVENWLSVVCKLIVKKWWNLERNLEIFYDKLCYSILIKINLLRLALLFCYFYYKKHLKNIAYETSSFYRSHFYNRFDHIVFMHII